MATTRLRQTFAYPTDDDPSTDPSSLDEQAQETLITSLKTKTIDEDRLYTLIFSILPLAPVLPLVSYLTTAPLLGLLAIASLIHSSYITYFIPIGSITRTPTLAIYLPYPLPDTQPSSKSFRYQVHPWANLALSLLLALISFIRPGNGAREDDTFGWLLLMPIVICVVTSVVRQSMADVQGGVKELEGLKYDLKGA